MTYEEAAKLKPGTKLVLTPITRPFGADKGATCSLIKIEDLLLYIRRDKDNPRCNSQSNGRYAPEDFELLMPKDFPHICPYCRAPALMTEKSLICNKGCTESWE